MKENQVLIKSGLTKLDEMIGGFKGGELAVIAAGPFMGKTALLQTIINNRPLKSKKPTILYFPLNVPMLEARQRLDCLNARVAYLKATWWKITPNELCRLRKARTFNFDDSGILISPGSSIALADLARAVRDSHEHYGTKVVVIDSLNLGMDRRPEEIAKICESLKRLAKRLNVALIVSCFINLRTAFDSKPPIPSLENLKDSWGFEKVADTILFIYREAAYIQRPVNSPPDPAQIIVAKNRSYRTGKVDVKFNSSYMRFDDI